MEKLTNAAKTLVAIVIVVLLAFLANSLLRMGYGGHPEWEQGIIEFWIFGPPEGIAVDYSGGK